MDTREIITAYGGFTVDLLEHPTAKRWANQTCKICKGNPDNTILPSEKIQCQQTYRELTLTLHDIKQPIFKPKTPSEYNKEFYTAKAQAKRKHPNKYKFAGYLIREPRLGDLLQKLNTWTLYQCYRLVGYCELGTQDGEREYHPHAHLLAAGFLCEIEVGLIDWQKKHGYTWRSLPLAPYNEHGPTDNAQKLRARYMAKHAAKEQHGKFLPAFWLPAARKNTKPYWI